MEYPIKVGSGVLPENRREFFDETPHEYIVQPLLPLHNGTQLLRQRLVNGVHLLEFIEHHNEAILSRRHLLQQFQGVFQHRRRFAH